MGGLGAGFVSGRSFDIRYLLKSVGLVPSTLVSFLNSWIGILELSVQTCICALVRVKVEPSPVLCIPHASWDL